MGFSGGASGKESACKCQRQKDKGQSLDREDLLEEGMATHSSILAWRIPMDRRAWRATVHGVAQSWTQLKRLSMQNARADRVTVHLPAHCSGSGVILRTAPEVACVTASSGIDQDD